VEGLDLTVTSRPAPHVLYLSYDGVAEPIGQSQIVPYLRGLVARGFRFTVISYEKPGHLDRRGRQALRTTLAAQGIDWRPLTYHKRPALTATVYDLVRGLALACAVALRDAVQLVHVRSYVVATIGLMLQSRGIPFLFDTRGLWVDERIEGGSWRRDSLAIRVARSFERRFFRRADAIITLSETGAAEARDMTALRSVPIVSIPTCVDFERFRLGPAWRAECRGAADPEAAFTWLYVGSLGTWYMLDEMLDFLRGARAAGGTDRLRIFTPTPEVARARAAALGLVEPVVQAAAAAHAEVPRRLAEGDAGLFFIRPTASKRWSCPTKLGELLASGVPVLTNGGIGDVERIVSGEGVGVVIKEFSQAEYRRARAALLELSRDPGLTARCQAVAQRHFALEVGVRAYEDLYGRLIAAGDGRGRRSRPGTGG
jgi:glycosyltransferase involved in cell wall biosynthesis